MNRHYPRVAERAGHRCEYCRAPEAIFNFPFEVEHIVPPTRGGSDSEENCALSCRACNVHKSDHTDGRDPRSGTVVPLFHPRQDQWAEHFTVDASTGALMGSTPIGAATIERLAMNRTAQRAARAQWMRLKLYPAME